MLYLFPQILIITLQFPTAATQHNQLVALSPVLILENKTQINHGKQFVKDTYYDAKQCNPLCTNLRYVMLTHDILFRAITQLFSAIEKKNLSYLAHLSGMLIMFLQKIR